MNRPRTQPDLTMRQPQAGVGMCQKLLFFCGHKSSTTGARMRGKLPMLCAACNTKGNP